MDVGPRAARDDGTNNRLRQMKYWISTNQFTIKVEVDGQGPDGKVTGGAPLIKKFIGQPIQNLYAWAFAVDPHVRILVLCR